MLDWIGGIAIALVVIYLACGVIAAKYHQGQTDDPFDWTLIFTWLYRYYH